MPAPIDFWGDNSYKHPPLTEEMVLLAERVLGVRLPEEYIDLLRIQNGGYTKGFGYPMTVRTSWAQNHVPLEDLAGIVIDPKVKTAMNVLATADMRNEWGVPPRQVLLSGDGHWWVTLDYRSSETPSVRWIDVETPEDILVAPSFAEFLNGLRPIAEFDHE